MGPFLSPEEVAEELREISDGNVTMHALAPLNYGDVQSLKPGQEFVLRYGQEPRSGYAQGWSFIQINSLDKRDECLEYHQAGYAGNTATGGAYVCRSIQPLTLNFAEVGLVPNPRDNHCQLFRVTVRRRR
jgi:hypothetical protein